VLERKGFVRHSEQDLRYIYTPTVPRETARRSALDRLVHTFFEGSAKQAVAAFLNPKDSRLSQADLEEISAMIETAKKERR
jgi:predicted transcriptional regulator